MPIGYLTMKQPFSKIFTVNDLFSPYLNQIITYFFSPECRVRTVRCLLMHNQEINSGMGAVSRKFTLFCTSARSDTSDASDASDASDTNLIGSPLRRRRGVVRLWPCLQDRSWAISASSVQSVAVALLRFTWGNISTSKLPPL